MARWLLLKQILKPVLAQNPDVVLIKRSLVMLPIRHVLRGVAFQYERYGQCGLHAGMFYDHICTGEWIDFPPPAMYFDFPAPYPKTWDRTRAEDMDRLRSALQNKVLPYLQTLDDLDRYAETRLQDDPKILEERRRGAAVSSFPCLIARGNLDLARQIARTPVEPVNPQSREHFRNVTVDRSAAIRRLCDLLERDDRAGMVEVLHQLEEMTATKSGFAHLWERTPFPLERML